MPNETIGQLPIPSPRPSLIAIETDTHQKNLSQVTDVHNQAPPVKERTMFLSPEHSTEKRMAFISNRPHPKLKVKLVQINDNKLLHYRYEKDKYKIHSVANATTTRSNFYNKYEPGEWTFLVNKRDPLERFHANDITVYQETKIATENQFIGIVPSLMIQDNVINSITLDETEGKSGEELKCIFLEKTPIGKLTQRILNDFGLKAIKVERITVNESGEPAEPAEPAEPDDPEYINFYIHVRPLPKEKIQVMY